MHVGVGLGALLLFSKLDQNRRGMYHDVGRWRDVYWCRLGWSFVF